MRSLITMLLMLSLISSAAALNNYVSQTNSETALASSTGHADQNDTNFAIVVGDENILRQSNSDYADVYQGAIRQKDANAAFIMGSGNNVTQINIKTASDYYHWACGVGTSAIDQIELNQVLVCGNTNSVYQSNYESAYDPGYVYQKEINFAAVVGADNAVRQSNTEYATHLGVRTINQSEKNIAYVYGLSNVIFQTNYEDGMTFQNCPSVINQTECNMAFIISRTPSTCTFEVPAGECPVMPDCSITCPGVPCPPAPCISFPFCPCPAGNIVGPQPTLPICPTQGRGCGNPTCPCQ